ncbi:MAG: M1 family aminopeptidase [Phycisphaerae bacterium]
MYRLLLSCGSCLWCMVASAQELEPPTPACASAKSALGALVNRDGAGDSALRGPGQQTDVLHYFADLECDFATSGVSGSMTITVQCLVDGVSSFSFRAFSELAINSCTVDGVPVIVSRLSAFNVNAALPRSYFAGEEFELRIVYAGQPVYGMWFTTHGTPAVPIVSTVNEPTSAGGWFVCKDDNRDKATADLWFTVPDTMTAVANGLLQGVDALPGGKSRFRWKTAYPTAPYLFFVSATNYNLYQRTFFYGNQTMPLTFYLYPESDTPAERSRADEIAVGLDTLSDLFGPYPFMNEKYGAYHFPWFNAGMEHQTLSGQWDFFYPLAAHEAAHQWWGDMVTCALWNDVWLNEGFATYGEVLWAEFASGGPNNAVRIGQMSARRPSVFSGSVYQYTLSNLFDQNTTYRKGAWVLNMLRGIVGDTAFFNILRTWGQIYQYDSATTADFQAVCEAISGQSLDWFFQPWVYGNGAITYRSAWRNVSVVNAQFVEVYLQQAQSASYPTFRMPVTLRFTQSGGGTFDASVINDAREEHFLIPTTTPATGLTVDPDEWILTTSKSSVPFVNSPPKVIAITPSPAAHVTSPGVGPIRVQFHVNVTLPPGAVSLSGARFGAIPATVSYNSSTYTASLTPAQPLRPDVYTLTVGDSTVAVIGGRALDGEIVNGVLPSGDGVPGGSAVCTFVVGPDGDLDLDGDVDESDLGLLLQSWQSTSAGDIDGDGDTDESDLGLLLANWGHIGP